MSLSAPCSQMHTGRGIGLSSAAPMSANATYLVRIYSSPQWHVLLKRLPGTARLPDASIGWCLPAALQRHPGAAFLRYPAASSVRLRGLSARRLYFDDDCSRACRCYLVIKRHPPFCKLHFDCCLQQCFASTASSGSTSLSVRRGSARSTRAKPSAIPLKCGLPRLAMVGISSTS